MKLTTSPIVVIVTLILVCSVRLSGSVMEWNSNFADITIAEHITTRDGVVSGSATTTLHTDGNVQITADNNATAQLSFGSDTLVTEYKLEYDGDGSTTTGGSTVDWTVYDLFLSSASDVTHVVGDDYVDVTLSVRASNDGGNVADAGTYTATQTLTAHWVGP